MHLFKERAVRDCAAAAQAVPVIDYGPRYPKAIFRGPVLEFYRASYFHQKGHQSEAARLAAAE